MIPKNCTIIKRRKISDDQVQKIIELKLDGYTFFNISSKMLIP